LTFLQAVCQTHLSIYVVAELDSLLHFFGGIRIFMASESHFEPVPIQELKKPDEELRNSEVRQPDWGALVSGIRSNDGAAMQQLSELLGGGARYLLRRHLRPEDAEDRLHDVFLIVVNAIRRDEIREPERLMGFVRTIIRRQIATCITDTIQSRRESVRQALDAEMTDRSKTPEQEAVVAERARLIQVALAELSAKDREVLVRFYLDEQMPATICSEMGLTETQFRLLKSRAKTKMGEAGRKKLMRTENCRIPMRAQAG
jgi:RNA polymerase sigma-70 factor (ECF subfamily)